MLLSAVAPSVDAQVAYAAALHQMGDVAAAEQALAAVASQAAATYQPYWAVQGQMLLK